jgi:hypothetical protein
MSDGKRLVYMMIYTIFMGILGKMAWEDGRTGMIRGTTLWIYSALGVVTAAVRYFLLGETPSWVDMGVLALILWILRKVTPRGMGDGDIWTLIGLPLYISETQMWAGIFYSMLFMILAAGWKYWRKKDRRAEIPYLPSLWTGLLLAGRSVFHGLY